MVMSEHRDSSKPPEPNQIGFITHNLSICMVSIDVDSCVKKFWNSGCDFSNLQIFTYDQIHEFVTVCPSSCTSLT